ncbi:hypothetical protein BSM4216_1317 [Bacillus smithii]|nr:hypothetical protein BSM4216_1317 [Bacillus smithii]
MAKAVLSSSCHEKGSPVKIRRGPATVNGSFLNGLPLFAVLQMGRL